MTDALITLLPQIMPTEMVGSVVHTDGLATSVAGFPAPVARWWKSSVRLAVPCAEK